MHEIEANYLSRIQALLDRENGMAATALRQLLFEHSSRGENINVELIDTQMAIIANQYGIAWVTTDWLQSLLQDCENRHCHHMSGTMTS